MTHVHEWIVMYDGSSELENVEIFALCIADAKAGKNIISVEKVLKGELPETCTAKLERREIEILLNGLEVNHWKNEIIRLARFLREKYPDDVRQNEQKPLKESSAVDLAIQLLSKP